MDGDDNSGAIVQAIVGRERSGRRYRRGELVRTLVQTISNRTQHRATCNPNLVITAARIGHRITAIATNASQENCPPTTKWPHFQ